MSFSLCLVNMKIETKHVSSYLYFRVDKSFYPSIFADSHKIADYAHET